MEKLQHESHQLVCLCGQNMQIQQEEIMGQVII
uniref:Uncharacterized protein n=1 Tax=Rhizophora mucronata TaxID=61149 RepID=A0A2P2PD97_RHIMU